MTTRDPRNRSRRYDGAVGQRQFARWVIRGIRTLAVPTVVLSLILAVDVALPGTAERGLVYRRAVDTRWTGPDGVDVSVGWPNRPNCLEQREGSGRTLLFTTRPDCAGTLSVSLAFGRRLAGNDTLRVLRTPLFGQVRAVHCPADGHTDEWYPLWDLGLYVAIGLVPLLSFGRKFGVYDTTGGVSRYHFAYLLPALAAEALYVWLLAQAVGGAGLF
jgi:hypothetical protein